MADVGKVTYKICGDNSQFSSDIGQTESIASGAGGRIAKTIAGAFAGAVAAGAATIGKLAKTGIEYNAQMEQYSTAFATLMGGNAAAADGLIGSLRDLAANTPLAMDSLASGAQTLMGYGISSDSVVDTLQMLGDAAMGDANKLNSLVLAYSQVQASGKLTGQDAMQMINAGIPIYQLLGDTMGITAGQAKELAGQGKISSEMVTTALKKATSEGGAYFGAMASQSQTLNGKISTLKDNFSQFCGELSESLMPAASGVVDALNEMITGNDDLKGALTNVFDAVAELAIGALPSLISMIGSALPLFADLATSVMPMLVDVFIEFLPPIMELAEAVFPVLVDVIKQLLPPLLDLAKTLFPALVDIITLVSPLVADLVEIFINLIEPILDVIEDCLGPLLEAFSPIIDCLSETLLPLLDNLSPAFELAFKAIEAYLEVVIPIITGIINGVCTAISNLIGVVGELSNMGDLKDTSSFSGNPYALSAEEKFKAENMLPENYSGGAGNAAGGGQSTHQSIMRNQIGEDFIMSDWTPVYLDRGERVLTAAENVKFNSLGGLQGMERSLMDTICGAAPTVLHINLQGDVRMDGYSVGRVVMENVDDVLSLM